MISIKEIEGKKELPVSKGSTNRSYLTLKKSNVVYVVKDGRINKITFELDGSACNIENDMNDDAEEKTLKKTCVITLEFANLIVTTNKSIIYFSKGDSVKLYMD